MKRRYTSIGAFLFGCLVLLSLEWRLQPDGKLHLHVTDVGQGDGMLLVTPSGKQVLIDGGPDATLLQRLGDHMPFLDRTIDLVILSHPDNDHISALPDVLRRYRVQQVALNGTIHPTGRYDALLNLIQTQKIAVISPDPSQDIDLGDGVLLDVIWPRADVFGSKPEASNDQSFVVSVHYHGHSVLLTGDIEKKVEDAILASGADIQAEIFKVPHHGSRTSSSTGFLLVVQPTLAVISVGHDNQFGHPHPEVIKRYESLGIPVRTTANEGTISLVFD